MAKPGSPNFKCSRRNEVSFLSSAWYPFANRKFPFSLVEAFSMLAVSGPLAFK